MSYILCFLVILLVLYLIYLKIQIRDISKQLNRRLTENTQQLLSIELVSSDLIGLSKNINNCLKAEEKLRKDIIIKESEFRDLIANISHDLRTPLTTIKGYMQFLENSNLDDSQKRYLRYAVKNCDELGTLIERFFEYSYLLNAQSELSIKKINLTNLLTESLVTSIPLFENNSIIVEFNELPIIYIAADSEMVSRVIQNLINNCAQYADRKVVVSLSFDEYAVMTFTNPVFEEDNINIERIFDRFHTSDKTRVKNKGLGLSIVKLLSEQMGGGGEAYLDGEMLSICVKLPLFK